MWSLSAPSVKTFKCPSVPVSITCANVLPFDILSGATLTIVDKSSISTVVYVSGSGENRFAGTPNPLVDLVSLL